MAVEADLRQELGSLRLQLERLRAKADKKHDKVGELKSKIKNQEDALVTNSFGF